MNTPNTPHEHNKGDADARLSELLETGRSRAWPGPDHNPRVDRFLMEIRMNAKNKSALITRGGIVLLTSGLLAGGAIGSVVTARVMSGPGVLTLDDGRELDVIVNESGTGTLGRMVTDDGRVITFDAPGAAMTMEPDADDTQDAETVEAARNTTED